MCIQSLKIIQNQIYKEAQRITDIWFVEQTNNPFIKLYAYYKPNNIDFKVGHEKPLGYKLIDQRRLSSGRTKEQVCRRIVELAQRLPILPATPLKREE